MLRIIKAEGRQFVYYKTCVYCFENQDLCLCFLYEEN